MVKRLTKEVFVESPYGRQHGFDAVTRVLHTIEGMYARHQIDERQKMAADRYRWAFEACPGMMRCALDTSGRGGGSELRSPTDNQRQAVEWLKEARSLLGLTDNTIVRRICGEGMTVDEVAKQRSGKASVFNARVVGDRLRTGLTVLANFWWIERHRLRASRNADARPHGADEREAFDPADFKGRVAHASPGRVFGFEPEGGQPGTGRPSRHRLP